MTNLADLYLQAVKATIHSKVKLCAELSAMYAGSGDKDTAALHDVKGRCFSEAEAIVDVYLRQEAELSARAAGEDPSLYRELRV